MQSERAPLREGWLPMQASTQYRRFAEECDVLARQAKTEHHRKTLLEMAEAWKKLAEETEKESH